MTQKDIAKANFDRQKGVDTIFMVGNHIFYISIDAKNHGVQAKCNVATFKRSDFDKVETPKPKSNPKSNAKQLLKT